MRAGTAIPLGRSLPSASCDRPERRRGGTPGIPLNAEMPAAPTWSCSRWGFPCHRRCRRCGALLPHHFTLAARSGFPRRASGILSVALSLGSPPPGVTRHRTSVEPGLSSPCQRRERPSDRLASKDLGLRNPDFKAFAVTAADDGCAESGPCILGRAGSEFERDAGGLRCGKGAYLADRP
jgi:hypothetical protein